MNAVVSTKLLVTHIRQCFLSLFDGKTNRTGHKGKIDCWCAKFYNSSKYWHYPIVTTSILKHCLNIGIKVDEHIQELSGVHQLSAFLKVVEKPLGDILRRTIADDYLVSVWKQIKIASYKETIFEEIAKVVDIVNRKPLPGISLFLHGSIADRKYTAFSDVDDLVVIRREAWQNAEVLMHTATILARVAREYQNIDPLQHHGHWVITEFDLLLYDQSYMPLVIFKEALRVTGESQIKFRVCSNRGGFASNARATIKSMDLRLKKAQQQGGLNAFELKCLVGEIAILPAYIFQAQGKMFSKTEAISQANLLYTPLAQQAINWATKVRNQFAPLVENRRTAILKTLAKLTCARRHQAEKLYRRWSSWVHHQHPLGISSETMSVIKAFSKESSSLVTLLEK